MRINCRKRYDKSFFIMKNSVMVFVLLFFLFPYFFLSCSSDSDCFEVDSEVSSLSLSMSREELQTRLDAIGEKYQTKIVIDNEFELVLINEKLFADLETFLSGKTNQSLKTVKAKSRLILSDKSYLAYIDDSSIDDIMSLAAPPSGEIYSGTFTKTINYICRNEKCVTDLLITWKTSTGSNNVVLTGSISMGHGSHVRITAKEQAGTVTNPVFNYDGVVVCAITILKKDTIYMEDEMDDGENHIYDDFIDGKPVRYEYTYEDYSSEHSFDGSYPN